MTDLQPLDLEVRRRIFDAPMNGRPIPSRAEIAAQTGDALTDVSAAFDRLAAAHMIVLQRDSGEVLMANPFSAVPTPFFVRAGDRSWYANCIWDAMGVAAMLNTDVTLDTSCGCCGTAITLRLPQDCEDSDERVAHFAIPAAHWWDDIVFN